MAGEHFFAAGRQPSIFLDLVWHGLASFRIGGTAQDLALVRPCPTIPKSQFSLFIYSPSKTRLCFDHVRIHPMQMLLTKVENSCYIFFDAHIAQGDSTWQESKG